LIIPIVPPRAADPHHLVGDRLVVGSEERANGGGDDVELGGGEGQRLGVGLYPLELDPVCLGLAAPGVEVLRRQIRGDHLGSGLGGADRGIARPRRDVEHPLPGRDPARPHQHLAELPDGRLGEGVVVAERPGGAGCRLQLAVGFGRRARLMLHCATVALGGRPDFARIDHLRASGG
jgi:hypothetical protein